MMPLHRLPRMLTLWLATALLIAACAPAAALPPTEAPTAPPLPPTEALPVAPPILTVSGPRGSQELALADLQALPVTEGYAGIKSSTGKITLPATYRGVSLADLTELVGGLGPGNGLNLVAKDGYAMTYSEDQVMKGAFIAYDPATGEELKSPPALTAILAYEMDGQPISDGEGPLRVAIVSAEGNQVTDGHWSVKWATVLEVRQLVQDWALELNGGLSDSVDRASFESCSAPQCHGAAWTDDQGQVWAGVPLWLLVGSVDDAIRHEGPAFNDDLASAGYIITVTASDGYSTEFESAAVARNPDTLVAHLVDGQPLPDKYFPLRLVGSTLAKNQMVGMIGEIVLGVEPVPTAASTAEPAPAGEVTLTIDGPDDAVSEFTDADLRALGVITKTLEHPKKGATEYQGVPLAAVLAAAGVTDAITTLEFVASDGYSAEVPAADVLACAGCLVTFGEAPGEYALAMPGLPSNAWVKGIARIEAK